MYMFDLNQCTKSLQTWLTQIMALINTARNYTFSKLKVSEMGPLRFRKRELKVTLARPLQMKGDLLSYKCLVNVS